jgi:aryl-alcohol dehydrogenase-like predicted oxidoreductase
LIKLAKKIVLGTAQFGLDYGINNKIGRISDVELKEIFSLCIENEIEYFDTAYSYGDSEDRIGKYSKGNKCKFNIISKLPACKPEEVANTVKSSLSKLNEEVFYGYLIHNIKSFNENPEVLDELYKNKEIGLIKKIGFSLYNVDELEMLFDKKVNFDLVQVPYNIFDQRFESYFKILKEKNIEIHTRSVFLQGLVFMNSENLSGGLLPAKEKIEMLNSLAVRTGLPIRVLCLSFVLESYFVNKVVIGIDGKKHLMELLESEEDIEKAFEYFEELKKLKLDNLNVLLPYKWIKQN